jgi:hypothetical protein
LVSLGTDGACCSSHGPVKDGVMAEGRDAPERNGGLGPCLHTAVPLFGPVLSSRPSRLRGSIFFRSSPLFSVPSGGSSERSERARDTIFFPSTCNQFHKSPPLTADTPKNTVRIRLKPRKKLDKPFPCSVVSPLITQFCSGWRQQRGIIMRLPKNPEKKLD